MPPVSASVQWGPEGARRTISVACSGVNLSSCRTSGAARSAANASSGVSASTTIFFLVLGCVSAQSRRPSRLIGKKMAVISKQQYRFGASSAMDNASRGEYCLSRQQTRAGNGFAGAGNLPIRIALAQLAQHALKIARNPAAPLRDILYRFPATVQRRRIPMCANQSLSCTYLFTIGHHVADGQP